MSIIAILAIIGLCVVLSKVSKFFTKLGKMFDAMGNKMIEYSYHKEYIRSTEVAKSKALRRARNEILEADYEKRVKEEINDLTK